MSEIVEWFRAVTDDDSVNAVAYRAGISQSTLARQLKADTLSPESIVAIARAYRADPIEALIIVCLITEDDLKYAGREALLADLTDREIADEVWERMQRGKATEALTGGHSHLTVIDGQPRDVAASDPGYDPDEEST